MPETLEELAKLKKKHGARSAGKRPNGLDRKTDAKSQKGHDRKMATESPKAQKRMAMAPKDGTRPERTAETPKTLDRTPKG